MSNRRDLQFFFTPHNKPTLLDCSFTVAATNGLGITGLDQGGRISNVFMNTSTTPGTAANGQVNPNPQAGVIIVNLQDNYNKFLGVDSSIQSPLTGTNISISGSAVMTVGKVYVITALGTTTQAQWQTAGLSSAIQAAVGVSFIAAITGGGTGTGVVQATVAAGAGIDHVEVAGSATLMNNSLGATIIGAGIGMQIILQCYKNGVLTAPTAGSLIGLSLYLNNSAQGV